VTAHQLPSSANQAPNEPKTNQHRQWSGAALGLLFGISGLILGRLGHLWIAFDVFSQFSIQFIFIGLSMMIAMAFPRFKVLAGIAMFIAMTVAYALWAQVNMKQTAMSPTSGEQVLRVASFNTFHDNLDLKAISTEILSLNADVITLIEFGQEKQTVLDAVRAIYPHQANCFSLRDCDQAIISKYPLTNDIGKINWMGPSFLRASLGPQFGNVTIFAVHTTRFPHPRAQFMQIHGLIKYVENIPGRVIIMGDFNATPFSRITQTLAEGLGLTRLTNLPTWPANLGFPQLAIDHIFVSEGIRELSSETLGNNAGSDHFPISLTLGISPN
jgi:endonuclease/exonuclease/phosphatase (EEP) superfamily protein YafD